MKTKKFKLGLLILLLIISSCSEDDNQINGSGDIITEERTVGIFDKVVSTSSIDINVIYGAMQDLTVSADDNVINSINTTVNNEILTIDLLQGNYNDITTSVTITIPEISEVRNTGSGNITCSGFIDLDNIVFISSGSGKVVTSGSATNMNMSNSGSGNFEGFDFITENSTINSYGSVNCELFCNISLNGTLSGSGSAFYKGTATVTINDLGSGNIVNLN